MQFAPAQLPLHIKVFYLLTKHLNVRAGYWIHYASLSNLEM
jgi:hypothetical protein